MADIPKSERPAASLEYYENNRSKITRKFKENPSVFLGVVGMVGMIGYGIYNFRKRGDMKISLYLIHLRVKAQAMVVGSISLGVGYSLIQDYIKEKKQNLEVLKDTELDKLH